VARKSEFLYLGGENKAKVKTFKNIESQGIAFKLME